VESDDIALRYRDVDALAAAGFDIAHAFDAAVLAREPGLEALAEHGRVGLLVGNTRELWRPFVAAVDRTRGHPLQHYTETIVDRELPGRRIYYVHRMYDGAYVPFQRLAVAVGLAAIAPTQLLVHPIYGPWFALRAVAFVDGDPPPTPPRVAKPCTCGAACTSTLARAIASRDWRDWLAVRDACPIGRTFRYSDEQIRYHYTKDPSWLRT
jgi:methylmalonic aciduria homocystinuria type C protein